MMRLFPRLLVGCGLLLYLFETSFANDIDTDKPSDETVVSSTNHKLSFEQVHYIWLECEAFAEEDKINPEKRAAYLETCVDELSIAVIIAIEKLQAKSESTEIDNDNSIEE